MFGEILDAPLLIRTLSWASARSTGGFTLEELRSAVATNEREWHWIQRMVLGEIYGEPILIAHLGHRQDLYFLTSSGASMLLDYIELKEERDGSKQALRFATISLIISTFVAILQIVLT